MPHATLSCLPSLFSTVPHLSTVHCQPPVASSGAVECPRTLRFSFTVSFIFIYTEKSGFIHLQQSRREIVLLRRHTTTLGPELFDRGAEVLEPLGLRTRVTESLRDALCRYEASVESQKIEKMGN